MRKMKAINQEKMKHLVEEFKKDMKEFRRSGICEGCRQNPETTKPFKKMKRLDIDTELIELFGKMDLNPSCVMCCSVKRFIKEFEVKT